MPEITGMRRAKQNEAWRSASELRAPFALTVGSATVRTGALIAALGFVACASPRSAPPTPPNLPPMLPAPAPLASNGPPAATSSPSSAASTTPNPAKLGFEFSRMSDLPVSSAAVGKPPKVAFLSASSVLVFDAKGTTTVAAPETTSDGGSVDRFFGRDDQPRLMGYRRADGGGRAEPFYRRFKGGRFQPEPSELGPLAAPEGALYGVLGHADPEVVCRPGSF